VELKLFFINGMKKSGDILKRIASSFEESLAAESIAKPLAILMFDTMMSFLSLFIAIYLKVGEEFMDYSPSYILKNMMVFALVSISVFCWMKTNKGSWKHVALQDLLPTFLSALFANILFLPLMILMSQQESLPNFILAINTLVLIALLGLPRFLYRLNSERRAQQSSGDLYEESPLLSTAIIIGDIKTLTKVTQPIDGDEENPIFPYLPIAAIIINPERFNPEQPQPKQINEIPVLGSFDSLHKTFQSLKVNKCLPSHIVILNYNLSVNHLKLILEISRTYEINLVQFFHISGIEVD